MIEQRMDRLRELNDAMYNKALEILKQLETALLALKASQEQCEALKELNTSLKEQIVLLSS